MDTAASCNEISVTILCFSFSIFKLRCENQPKNFYKINRIYTRKKKSKFSPISSSKNGDTYMIIIFKSFFCTFPIPIKEDFFFFLKCPTYPNIPNG
jgi:hypothetical protein